MFRSDKGQFEITDEPVEGAGFFEHEGSPAMTISDAVPSPHVPPVREDETPSVSRVGGRGAGEAFLGPLRSGRSRGPLALAALGAAALAIVAALSASSDSGPSPSAGKAPPRPGGMSRAARPEVTAASFRRKASERIARPASARPARGVRAATDRAAALRRARTGAQSVRPSSVPGSAIPSIEGPPAADAAAVPGVAVVDPAEREFGFER